MLLRGNSQALLANWDMASSTLLLPSSSTSVSSLFLPVTTSTQKTTIFKQLPQTRKITTLFTVSSSSNQPAKSKTSAVAEDKALLSIDSASDIVRNFYSGINAHDLASVEDLISENCVYEDLVFPQPFVGRKAILEFFKKFIDSISKDLQFVIDDVSNEDSLAVGVTWHLEWQGRAFPFSRGCSFYRLEVVNGKKQITYGRDSVEPAIKPGETALVAIKGVTWLLQKFPQLADRL